MKKITTTLILIVFFLIASAATCSRTTEVKEPEFLQGTEAIETSFLANNPPDSVLEASEFQIAAEISNKGASDVSNGYLILNLEPAYMELKNWNWDEFLLQSSDESKATFNLKGKNEFNPFGEQGIINAVLKAKEIETLISSHTTTVGLTSCYTYKTKANPTLCIDPDVLSVRKEKPCTSQDVLLKDQGAPVAITKVETNLLSKEDQLEPQFIIHIENKGNGQIFDNEKSINFCSGNTLEKGEDIFGKIHINAELFNKELNCTPNPLKLTKSKNTIRCSAKEQDRIEKDDLTYSTVLNIELDYGYTSTTAKQVIIEKLR